MTEAPEPGMNERAVIAAFDVANGGEGFATCSYDQYAPDGENVIGRFYFLVCSLCAAMVPIVDQEKHPGFPGDETHVQFHLDLAKVVDRMIENQR